MKNIWKIAIALTLVFCLCVAFVACKDKLEEGTVYVTDEAGETILDEQGNPVTAPDENGDGQPDESTIHNAGADSETGFGKIIAPNKTK